VELLGGKATIPTAKDLKTVPQYECPAVVRVPRMQLGAVVSCK